jgi:transposase
MRRIKERAKIAVTEREVFVRIDVHKESWQVTVRRAEEEVFHGRIASDYRVLRRILNRFAGSKIKVAYEAGPCGFGLHDQLTEDGIEAIVVPPSLIPIESGNKVKTDKRDSRKLARLLESNMLKRVHVLSLEDRADRELLRTRRQVLEHRNDVARQIKSKLLFYGIRPPFSAQAGWSKAFIQWIKDLRLGSEDLKVSFLSLVELYEYLTGQVITLSRKVVQLSRTEKYRKRVQLLRSVPGMGVLIAVEILVEIQDGARFKRAEELASYIGLTPSEFSTGERVRQGRITRCGNKRVRTCLVEASWILIQKDWGLRKKYDRLKQWKGGKRTIIAIARHLIIRIRRILLNQEPYVVGVAA